VADEDTFRIWSWSWPLKTATARSPLASDSTTPFWTVRPVLTPPTYSASGSSIVKKPPFVAATAPSAADAAWAVVQLAIAGP
jgi:hypothetical protein